MPSCAAPTSSGPQGGFSSWCAPGMWGGEAEALGREHSGQGKGGERGGFGARRSPIVSGHPGSVRTPRSSLVGCSASGPGRRPEGHRSWLGPTAFLGRGPQKILDGWTTVEPPPAAAAEKPAEGERRASQGKHQLLCGWLGLQAGPSSTAESKPSPSRRVASLARRKKAPGRVYYKSILSFFIMILIIVKCCRTRCANCALLVHRSASASNSLSHPRQSSPLG